MSVSLAEATGGAPRGPKRPNGRSSARFDLRDPGATGEWDAARVGRHGRWIEVIEPLEEFPESADTGMSRPRSSQSSRSSLGMYSTSVVQMT
jgi:hypothetical protein